MQHLIHNIPTYIAFSHSKALTVPYGNLTHTRGITAIDNTSFRTLSLRLKDITKQGWVLLTVQEGKELEHMDVFMDKREFIKLMNDPRVNKTLDHQDRLVVIDDFKFYEIDGKVSIATGRYQW